MRWLPVCLDPMHRMVLVLNTPSDVRPEHDWGVDVGATLDDIFEDLKLIVFRLSPWNVLICFWSPAGAYLVL